MLLDEDMTEWVVARLRGEKRRNHERTPASAALWRAFRALSAARYHLQDQPMEDEVRDLRNRIEVLWRDVSPLHRIVPNDDEPDEDDAADLA